MTGDGETRGTGKREGREGRGNERDGKAGGTSSSQYMLGRAVGDYGHSPTQRSSVKADDENVVWEV